MMDQEEEFRQFRPYCLVLTTQPSKEVLCKLQELCDKTNHTNLQNLQEYILFPMQLYLKNPNMPENYTLAVIDFITSFFKRCQLQSFFFLKDIINSCLALVAPPKKVSEDLQLSFCSCLKTMLQASGAPVLVELFSEGNNMKLPLSHTIFLTLTWTEEQEAPNVKCSAISLLNALCLTDSEEMTIVFSLWAAMFVNLLPGITSKLVKITQDPKITHAKVKALAVSAWGRYVTSILSDKNFPQVELDNLEIQPLKDAVWLKNAQKQITQQVSNLEPLASHSDIKIRQALLKCASSMLTSSKVTLEPCFKGIVDIVITLSVDEHPNISDDATSAISMLVENLGENVVDLSCSINKKLYEKSEGLVRSLGLYENENLERSLSLVKGYLNFVRNFGCDSTFFHSPIRLRTLIQSLIKVSEIGDTSTILMGGAEDFSNFEFLFKPEFYLTSSRPRKTFVHLKKPRLVQLIRDICEILGSSEAFSIVVQLLIEGMEELEHFKRETIWLLNKVIEGAKNNSSETVNEILRDVLNKYLTLEDVDKNAVCKVSKNPIFISDEWTVCLLGAEGLGILCRILGDELKSDIPVVLLHLVSTTNLANRLAAHVLYFALGDIASGCGTQIYQLLADNVDHLARDLNLMLRKWGDSSPGLPTLIRVVLKVSTKDQEQHDLQDTMESLLNHLAVSSESKTLEILDVVKVFVFGVREKLEQHKKIKTDAVSDDKSAMEGSIANMILKLEKERADESDLDMKISECPGDGFHSDNRVKEDDDDIPEDDTEETKPPLTADQKFLHLVISHCRHFISLTGQPSWQLSALTTVSYCLDMLATTPHQSPGQNQEVILPLVHQTWHPLRLLFKSPNIFIVERAFDCLMVIARHAKDFVHKRTVSDVFPPLLKFFQTLQLMVADRDKHNTLAATQSRRILTRLSGGVWDLLELLNLQPLETDPIIQLLLEHLGDKLDIETEDGDGSSKTCLRPKRNLDSNILWLKLNHKSS